MDWHTALYLFYKRNVLKFSQMTKFKQGVLEMMLTDVDLYAKVAKAKGVRVANLGTVIRRNGSSINQYGIVKLVADHLGVSPDDVVEEVKVHPEAA